MKKLLSMGLLAVALSGATTAPATASGINFRFGIHFDFSFNCAGYNGHHGCRGRRCNDSQYLVTFPAHEDQAAHAQPFPPTPNPDRPLPRGEPKKDEQAAQWGYPALNYSFYHPVSHYTPAAPQAYYPAESYYPQPSYYYPPTYYPSTYAPSYYPQSGMTFDR